MGLAIGIMYTKIRLELVGDFALADLKRLGLGDFASESAPLPARNDNDSIDSDTNAD